jgi:hypothetical protein
MAVWKRETGITTIPYHLRKGRSLEETIHDYRRI